MIYHIGFSLRGIMGATGFFVSVEGVEGVGKSTAIKYIQQLFSEAKID